MRSEGGSTPGSEPLDAEAFDAFVEGLDYPVFVVTTRAAEERAGCLVGFATQASIDPPRMLVCLSVQNRTYRVARAASALAVHVLAPEQHEFAALFGGETGDETDKFDRCAWQPGPEGVPIVDQCRPVFVGRILERLPLGDHVGFLLEPVAVRSAGEGPALTLQQVDDLEPGHPA